MTASIVGTIVASIHDDSPCPVTGRITGQVDEEWVDVAWGDQQDADYPTTRREACDELRVVRAAAPSVDQLRAEYAAAIERHSARHARIMANLNNPAGVDWHLWEQLHAEQEADWTLLDANARQLREMHGVLA